MEVEVLDSTTRPLDLMGTVAGSTRGNEPKRPEKVALSVIKSGHGRVLEYADVVLKISGISARVAREFYTHIIGVSRLQESTRYMNMNDFDYYTPESVVMNSEKTLMLYEKMMEAISGVYRELIHFGIPVEDVGNILPLAYKNTITVKINVRALIHMAEERLCRRTYKEYRDLMVMIRDTLKMGGKQWKKIASMMKPKCEVLGYCIEKETCGMIPTKKEVLSAYYGENSSLVKR
jgi:thymidylate synthase (FAD)